MQIVVLWHKTLCGSQFVLWHKTLRDKVVLWHKTHQKCKLLSYGIRHCVGVKLSYGIKTLRDKVVLCYKTLRGSQVVLCHKTQRDKVVLCHKTVRGSQVVLWHKTLRGSQVVLCHKTHVKCKLLSYGIRHCVGVKLSRTE